MGGKSPGALVVRRLEPAAADDGTLVARLTSVINDVYLAAERRRTGVPHPEPGQRPAD